MRKLHASAINVEMITQVELERENIQVQINVLNCTEYENTCHFAKLHV